ncbi:Phosphate transport system regulatory protein PhoU [Pseudomonas yamanorum]
MGHSADYQIELHIKQLEQIMQTLFDRGVDLKDAGYDDLAYAAFDQSAQLKRVIAVLRKTTEK